MSKARRSSDDIRGRKRGAVVGVAAAAAAVAAVVGVMVLLKVNTSYFNKLILNLLQHHYDV